MELQNYLEDTKMSEFIHTECQDHVLLMQITYEKTLNCLNNDILQEMSSIVRRFSRNPDVYKRQVWKESRKSL